MAKNQQNRLKLQNLIDEAYQIKPILDNQSQVSEEINNYICIKDESNVVCQQSKIPLLMIPSNQKYKVQTFTPFENSRRDYVDQQYDKNINSCSPKERINQYLSFNRFHFEQIDVNSETLQNCNSARQSSQQSPKFRQRVITQQQRILKATDKKNNQFHDLQFLRKVAETSMLESQNLQIHTYLYIAVSDTMWKPQIRVGSSLSQIGSFCYLYGGRGQDIYNSVCKLSLDKIKWEPLENSLRNTPEEGRVGHSSSVYKETLYIFGGEMHFNSKLKQHECTNSTIQFIPLTNEWKSIRCFGEFVEARRYHTACVLGKFLVIIGGINSIGKVLHDVNILNLESHKWQAVAIDTIPELGLSFHQATTIFRGDFSAETPYSPYEIYNRQDQGNLKIKYEGIYIFGGQNSKRQINNTLSIIQFGHKPLSWFEPITTGQPPVARYQHALNYLMELQKLVVSGGRNDDNLLDNGIQSGFVNEIKVLSLDTMIWLGVVVHGSITSDRCLHNSIQVDSKLILFGGSSESYITPNLLIMEFDTTKIKHLSRMKKKQGELQIDKIMDNKEMLWMDTQSKLNPVKEEKILNQFLLNNFQTQWDQMNYDKLQTFLPLPERQSSQLIKKFLVKRYTKNIVDKSIVRVQTSRDELDRTHGYVPHALTHLSIPTLETQLTRKIQKKIQNKEQLEKWVDSCVNRIMSHVD